MTDNVSGPGERVIRGVGEVGRGLGEMAGGVRDAAVAGAETAKETLKSRLPNDRQTRDNVVMVRVDKESLARMDELVEAGIATSRSDAANYLITAGIKARQGHFDAISTKLEEIRKAKADLRDILEQEGEPPQE